MLNVGYLLASGRTATFDELALRLTMAAQEQWNTTQLSPSNAPNL